MYEFSPVDPRVARIRQRYRETKPKVCMERFRLVTEFYKANPAMPPMIKRAKNLLNICENIPFLVNEDEVIVGELGSSYRCSALYPEYAIGWMFDEIRSGEFYTRPLDPYDIDPEDVEYFMRQEDFWRTNDLSRLTTEALPPEFSDIVGNGVVTFRDKEVAGGPVGHFCANYDKAIRKGFGAIKVEAQAKIDAIKGRLHGDDAEKEQFYRAVTICCDAMIVLAKRYAAECSRQAGECTDVVRKAELVEMAEGLYWIMQNPARTFLEAVQAMFLYQIALSHDGNLHGLSFGRVDQYLGRFYEADLAAGRITRERAQEIIDLFCLKVAEMNKIWSSMATQSASGYTSGQLITIGGVTKDGADATNEVSYMLLEASRRLKLHDPPVSLRIHEGTPDRLWDIAIESTKVNGGVPTFESDKVIVANMLDRGLSLESARNYCLIGCVEPGGCGDDWPACGGPGQESFWRIPSALLLAINNGTNPMPDWGGAPMRQTGLATGYLYEMKSFDEVLEAVKRQIEYFIDWQCAFTSVREVVARHHMPLPIVSATVDGCLESGKDVMWGGAKYNGTGFAGVGIGTVADSLATIKYAVFDEELCTARELYDAVFTNWEGAELLRHRLIKEVPHYGNDLEYPDAIAEWLSKVIADKVRSCTGPRGNHWNAGLYPVATHVLWGKLTWATPDGRRTGDPLSDGISPIQCMDTNGPVSTLKSALRIDHRHNANGTLLNMKFHPKALEGDGKSKLISLIQTYFDLDGMELQFNITSAETLKNAQLHPDDHKDLIVRIAGFSSYFVELHKDMQDDVIKRTELELAQ
jgi:pyruvate formate-lyase/glycerol dehydratase family glycyl radical enzyme